MLDNSFASLDAGTGIDTVQLAGAGATLDLTTIGATKFVDVEIIDLTGTGNNSLTMALPELVHSSASRNTLTVLGDAGDTVTADLSAGSFVASTVVAGFTDYSNGVLTLRVADAVTQTGVAL